MVCLGTFLGKFSLSGDFFDKCLVSVRLFNFRASWQPLGENPDRFHVSTPPPKNPEKKLKSSSPKIFLLPLVTPDIKAQHSHHLSHFIESWLFDDGILPSKLLKLTSVHHMQLIGAGPTLTVLLICSLFFFQGKWLL